MERSGGSVRYFLNYWSASSDSSFHMNLVFLRNSLKNRQHLSEDLLMNRLRAAAILVSCTSFAFLGLISWSMAAICSGLASIPCLVTKCPRNLPELTPKVHFAALSLSLCCRRIAKISNRSLRWSDSYLLFTTMSSMYASMVFPKTDLNILVTIL